MMIEVKIHSKQDNKKLINSVLILIKHQLSIDDDWAIKKMNKISS